MSLDTEQLQNDYPNLDSHTLDRLAAFYTGENLDLSSMPIIAARSLAEDYLRQLSASLKAPLPAAAIDRTTCALPHGLGNAYIYHHSPENAETPLVIWFHGGGWVLGSAALHAAWGAEFAARAQCTFIDVDYPLAPENAYDTIINSCVSTLAHCKSISRNSENRPIIVGGESAGATLALLLASKVDGIDRVVAVNPIIDLRKAVHYDSRRDFDDPRLMQSWSEIEWFINQFVDDGEREPASIILSPLDLPAVKLILGEYDMLLDESLAFSRAVAHAGGAIAVKIISGALHNSVEFGPGTKAGKRMIEAIAAAINATATGISDQSAR